MPGARVPRIELKMVCDGTSIAEVRSSLLAHSLAFVKTYRTRRVNNIYFDTENLDTFRDHLGGVAERRKLRFRWYGQENCAVQGALEIKQKLGAIGWKMTMPLINTVSLGKMSWLEIKSILVEKSDAVFRELLGVSRPILINNYWREYYVSADRVMRLTLDHKLTTYDQRCSARPNLRFQTPQLNVAIIEIKSSIHTHHHLADMIAGFPLRVERYSKYVDALSSIIS